MSQLNSADNCGVAGYKMPQFKAQVKWKFKNKSFECMHTNEPVRIHVSEYDSLI